jgi:hypothetical protein
MPAPLSLTDEEMVAVMDAAAPIDPAQRDAFLRDIAIELSKCPEQIGPGSVYRTVREVQRRYVVTPLRTWDAIGKRL